MNFPYSAWKEMKVGYLKASVISTITGRSKYEVFSIEDHYSLSSINGELSKYYESIGNTKKSEKYLKMAEFHFSYWKNNQPPPAVAAAMPVPKEKNKSGG